MTALPTFRIKIYRSFLILVVLFCALGFPPFLFLLSTGGMATDLILAGYFLMSVIFSVLLADYLASRLAAPIKSLAEVLQGRPEAGKKLKLGQQSSLELFVLVTELDRLWKKVSEAEKFDVGELLHQNHRLGVLLEAVEDALLVIDTDGRVTHTNSCLLQLIDLPREKVVGQDWRDLSTLHENYLQLRSLFNESMTHSQEVELLTSQHQRRTFSARVKKIPQEEKQPAGLLYLLHDITEKKQRDQFRSDLIDSLSQELTSPLQSLGKATELLVSQKDSLPVPTRKLIEILSEDVERIRASAHEFDQVTQGYAKAIQLKFEACVVSDLLPEWVKPFRVLAKDRDVILTYTQEGSERIHARLDLVKFPWVIANLVSNAIRFSPINREVSVLLTDRNGAVEIQVKDEGPGVPLDQQDKIFDPLFHSPMTTSSGKQGLFGMGLTIVKEIIEAHCGRIEYFRRPSGGSEFRITLPFLT